jgi:hypothetical protein
MGVRPRLVIFDYLDSPVAGQLRAMATELDMIVGVEPFERSLPTANLRDRFRLLEKSKGIHGIFFPPSMTPAHRAGLDAHPTLASLALDKTQEGLSPQVVSFLQLAAVHGWNPEGRSAAVVYSAETLTLGQMLSSELEGLGMRVTRLAHPAELSGTVSRSSLLWLCHGRPLDLARLHLSPDAVVVDSGRALDLGSSISEAQSRLLPHRVSGLCPAEAGLWVLVNLNRIHRLLLRALGPRRPRTLSVAIQRGRVRG